MVLICFPAAGGLCSLSRRYIFVASVYSRKKHARVPNEAIHHGFPPLLTAHMVVRHPDGRKKTVGYTSYEGTILEKPAPVGLVFTDVKRHSKNNDGKYNSNNVTTV